MTSTVRALDPAGSAAPPRRKLWLDWQRGLAVLFMVEVHVLDAWLAVSERSGVTYDVLRMIGGFAAPGFLYMAGLSQALADAAMARKGATPRQRLLAALRRGLWLLGVAYAFRLTEFLFGRAFLRPDGWRDLFRVDILNIIAVGLLLSALLTAGRRRGLATALAAAGAALVVLVTPPIADALRHYDLPSATRLVEPPILQAPNHAADVLLAYLYGRYPRAIFSIFNWTAFLLAGAALAPLALRGVRAITWLGAAALLAGAGLLVDRGPDFYALQDYWHTSPAWFLLRLGGCVALSGLLQLLPAAAERALGWLTQLGRESLVAYLVSVELTYGVLVHSLSRRLSMAWTLAGMVAMAAFTWVAVVAWARLLALWRARGAARGGGASPPAVA
ncbi:MAG: heparan-alpha-glucosaminide N-acetyltransferase domain-containing protein [Anaeromyxobacter sp.]